MNTISCIVFVAVVTAISSASLDRPHYDVNNAPALFEKYVKDYDKTYKDEADRKIHYDAFVKSLEQINELNAENRSAIFDINYLADYTPEEMKNMMGFVEPKSA